MNIVFISKKDTQRISARQKASILEAIRQHNTSLFDQNDKVEEEIEEGADFTCIGGEDAGFFGENCGNGHESHALTQLYGTITSILEN